MRLPSISTAQRRTGLDVKYLESVITKTAAALYGAQAVGNARQPLTLEQAYRSDAVAVLDALDDLGLLDRDALEWERPGGVVDSSTWATEPS